MILMQSSSSKRYIMRSLTWSSIAGNITCRQSVSTANEWIKFNDYHYLLISYANWQPHVYNYTENCKIHAKLTLHIKNHKNTLIICHRKSNLRSSISLSYIINDHITILECNWKTLGQTDQDGERWDCEPCRWWTSSCVEAAGFWAHC